MSQAELTEEQSARIRDFVAALRSGEYAQCSGVLSLVDERSGRASYCCQGVALERYGKALGYHVNRAPHGSLHGRDPQITTTSGSVLIAPRRFWQDMGMLNESSGGFSLDVMDLEGNDTVAYSELNDHGFTFDQIADLIEWQFLSGVEVSA